MLIWQSNERWRSEGKKTKPVLLIVVFKLSHGCSDWWGFELYLTSGLISVFVCVGIWLTLVWWCICPVDRLQRGNQERERKRGPDGDGDGLAKLTGRCLWAIIYKLFNLGYFLALGNGWVCGSCCMSPSTSGHPSPSLKDGAREGRREGGRLVVKN